MAFRSLWFSVLTWTVAAIVSCGPDLLEEVKSSRRSEDQPTLEQSVSLMAGPQGRVFWTLEPSEQEGPTNVRVVATIVRPLTKGELSTIRVVFDHHPTLLAYAEVDGRRLPRLEACLKLALLCLADTMESTMVPPRGPITK